MDDNAITVIFKAVGIIFSVLAASAILMVWGAFVLVYLWGWFLVPYGAPVLTLWPAMGIWIVASYLTHQSTDVDLARREVSQWERWVSILGYPMLRPALMLLMGWCVSRFL